MGKLRKATSNFIRGMWRNHKIWTVVILFAFVTFIISPLISGFVDFFKNGTNPFREVQDQITSGVKGVLGLVIAAVAIGALFIVVDILGPSSGSGNGSAMSRLRSRASVHPQSDYREQERAAREARDAAEQGREALAALEKAGGDPATIQALQWEISQADQDAKKYQEWSED